MICKHCHEEVSRFVACQSVSYVQEVRLDEGIATTEHGFHIEFPRGKPQIRFRCGHCGGDLSDKHRECLGMLRKGGFG